METQGSNEEEDTTRSDPKESHQSTSATSTSSLVRRDVNDEYAAWARDPKNATELKTTRKWLEDHIHDKNMPIIDAASVDGSVWYWYGLTFDEAGLKAAEEYPGIKAVHKNAPVTPLRSTTRIDQTGPSTILRNAAKAARRAIVHLKRATLEWVKYKNAPRVLVVISQPKNKNLDELTDYIHEKRNGEGTFIYGIDRGINPHVKNTLGNNEFKRTEVDQMPQSIIRGEKPDVDESDASHGTAVASVACGQRYGVASEATLVYVKYGQGYQEWVHAIRRIGEKIPVDRASKSVILIAHELVENTWQIPEQRELWRNFLIGTFQVIHHKGIPVVVAAGNSNDKDNTKPINSLPQDINSDNVPLIVTGASTFEGYRWTGSQTGPKLTVYAPGDKVAVQTKEDRQDGIATGTSFAAPAVAGLIASYLAYDDPPWGRDSNGRDFDGKARVEAIRRYITSEASSYVRAKEDNGVNIIWNGALEDVSDDSSPTSTYTFTDLECYAQTRKPKLGGKKQDYLDIHEAFCNDIETHDHTGTNVYNEPFFQNDDPNVPAINEVQFSVWWPEGSTFTPDKGACMAAIEHTLWNCDYGDGHTSGGQVTVGRVGYRVEPMYEGPLPTPTPSVDPDRPKPGQCVGSQNTNCQGGD